MSHHRVTISGVWYLQTFQNVLHFRNLDGLLSPQAIANDVLTNWVNRFKQRQVSSLKYTNILVQNEDNPNLAPFSLAIDVPGTHFNEDRMPSFTCLVLKKLTERAGRHGRGRVYLAGPSTDDAQVGIMTSSFIAGFKTVCLDPAKASYVGPGHTSALDLCVREEAPDGTFVYHPLIDLQLRNTYGVQRRRNIGVGV